MSITAGNLVRKVFSGNDATTAFDCGASFVIHASDDIDVYIVTNSTGVAVLQTAVTHYTAALTTASVNLSTVIITMVTAPATGETLLVLIKPDQEQGVDYVDGAATSADTLETNFDKIILLIKAVQEELDRSVKLNVPYTTSDVDPTLPVAVTLADL